MSLFSSALLLAGWAKVGITWAYCIVVWLLADVAKTLSQSFFVRQERVKEDCKMRNKAVPAWARAIDWPGELAESACEAFERALKVRHASSRNVACLHSTAALALCV